MKILLLGGGASPERSVSLRSSTAVRDALTDLGHEVIYVDPIEGDGVVVKAAEAADIILPILHGAGGEDGEIQSLLERIGKPYLGSRVEASQRCFDKVVIKELLIENGLPTANFSVVSLDTISDSPLMKNPFVLKPILGGSSIDLVIERAPRGVTPEIIEVFSRHHELLLEELIEGVEITVPILGNKNLPVIEIVPPVGEEFDYDNKYNGETAELCPPKNVSRAQQNEAQEIAMKLHRLVGARHLSRTDMIVTPKGDLFVLEINTMPGMSDVSLFPKSAEAAGLTFKQLVTRFVEMARG